jgi:amino acid adenylation domain-containing protein
MRQAEGLWHRFARCARRRPNAQALRDVTASYTYSQAHRLSLTAASALAAVGLSPGDTVLVCTDRNVDGIVALLAVAAAGGTPVPIEPESPAPRLERIAAAAGARLALVDDLGGPAVAARGMTTLHIQDALGQAPADGTNPAPRAAAELAHVLFTSGSTGVPKGVEVTQANMAALLDAAPGWDTSAEDDVWACYHAFTFDVSIWEIWRPLTLGAQVFVLPRAAQLDGDLAYSLVDSHGVTGLCHTPTAARLLTGRIAKSGLPGRLRRLLIGGERLDFASLGPLAPAVADGRLEIWNMYGPTETTTYSTAHRISAADIEHESRSLIGRALPDTITEIRDADSDGVGELWISGDGVTAGYRGDPGLTGERFVTGAGGRRAYRTGDLVRDTGGGVLEFVGRAGGFVKVRGFRIEPGEVVTAMCAHPAVAQAAATVSDAFPWGATVVCAVVPQPGAAVAEVDLRRHAAALLPGYMCPGRIVFLDALPLLPSGKLDELALRSAVHLALGLPGAP